MSGSSADLTAVAVPGQRLADAQKPYVSGHGTYVRDGSIYASILGRWTITNDHRVQVSRHGDGSSARAIGSAQVLRLGDPVLCRVTKVTTRQVLVDIVCVRDTVLQESFPGTIRLEDVRSFDLDKLVIESIFSPGMLVKALVLSFGDTRSYFLSTAKPGLGIVNVVQEDTDAMDTD